MLCCPLTFLIAPPLIIFNLPSTRGPGKQWRFSGNTVARAAGLICRQQREAESDGDSETRLEQTRERSFRQRCGIATVSSGGRTADLGARGVVWQSKHPPHEGTHGRPRRASRLASCCQKNSKQQKICSWSSLCSSPFYRR